MSRNVVVILGSALLAACTSTTMNDTTISADAPVPTVTSTIIPPAEPTGDTIQPSDADGCAATFYPAVESGLIRQPRAVERFMVSFQDSDEWDGAYPVCWAVYQSEATGCEFFALHMDGAYSEAAWVESGIENPPCDINVTSDSESYREYSKP